MRNEFIALRRKEGRTEAEEALLTVLKREMGRAVARNAGGGVYDEWGAGVGAWGRSPPTGFAGPPSPPYRPGGSSD